MTVTVLVMLLVAQTPDGGLSTLSKGLRGLGPQIDWDAGESGAQTLGLSGLSTGAPLFRMKLVRSIPTDATSFLTAARKPGCVVRKSDLAPSPVAPRKLAAFQRWCGDPDDGWDERGIIDLERHEVRMFRCGDRSPLEHCGRPAGAKWSADGAQVSFAINRYGDFVPPVTEGYLHPEASTVYRAEELSVLFAVPEQMSLAGFQGRRLRLRAYYGFVPTCLPRDWTELSTPRAACVPSTPSERVVARKGDDASVEAVVEVSGKEPRLVEAVGPFTLSPGEGREYFAGSGAPPAGCDPSTLACPFGPWNPFARKR